jgi:hypothetical protein
VWPSSAAAARTDEGRRIARARSEAMWRTRAPRLVECQHCPTKFESVGMRAKFCSPRCKMAAARERGAYDEERRCLGCGDAFAVYRWKPNRCCSRVCAQRYRAGHSALGLQPGG